MFKVLIVDDDANIRLFLERLLTKRFSCKVVTAKNGLEALSMVKQENPEVVFLDVTMPIMDGIETLTALRADASYGHLPIIMLTAISDKNVVSKVMDMGVLSYILKPLMYDSTYEKLRELFSQIKKSKEKKELIRKKEELESKIEYTDKLLIVDTDEAFRKKLGEQMAKSYKILEADNGAVGLDLFMKERPKTVCLGEKLPLLNEKLLAQKIRSIDSERKVTIFITRDIMQLQPDEKDLYDLIVPRSEGFKTSKNT